MPGRYTRGKETYPLPTAITSTELWRRIQENPAHAQKLIEIRKVSELLASKIAYSLPGFTDHSVVHMDALWRVTDQVLTQDELSQLTQAEALLLASGFYVHDLGMALSTTPAGQSQIRSSVEYESARARFKRTLGLTDDEADSRAMIDATRELHAKKALELVTQPLPGLDQYLIEDTEFRSAWGYTIGQLAQSHHWDLITLERVLGSRNRVPCPNQDHADLGYIACVMRLVDAAHINFERAPWLERKLRATMLPASATHWNSQEYISGPLRVEGFLTFASLKPIAEIDAWWLFYDLAVQLDTEIRDVHEYLRGRTVSTGRFSLKGVKGTQDPARFNQHVHLPPGVAPIDIRVQPDSMDRVVDLLGGRHIYGPDQLAPLRELIQNARDAIELRHAIERARNNTAPAGSIVVALVREGADQILKVRDNGIGMTKTVVRKHLVGVGSDFWNSPDFYREYSAAIDAGFHPIGKFGIGFLSVFMFGNHVEVETEAAGHSRIQLTLRGVGRRGELCERPATGEPGTEVRITLSPHIAALLEKLAEVVRSRAPMLPLPITVIDPSKNAIQIAPGWWKTLSHLSFLPFVRDWNATAFVGGTKEAHQDGDHDEYSEWLYRSHADFGGKWTITGWPAEKPHHQTDIERLISMGNEPAFGVIRCSQGIAVDVVRVPDVCGMVEVGPADLVVSREAIATTLPGKPRHTVSRAIEQFAYEQTLKLRPSVVRELNGLASHGMIPGRINFIRGIATIFGLEVLHSTSLAWIPLVEPPGNLIHRSRREFIERIRKYERLLLATGVTMTSIYSLATRCVVAADLPSLPVLAITKEEVNIRYSKKNDLEAAGKALPLEGPLNELRAQTPEDEWKLVLCEFVLQCLAEAWSMPIADLKSQTWFLDYKDDVLWSDLKKAAPLQKAVL